MPRKWSPRPWSCRLIIFLVTIVAEMTSAAFASSGMMEDWSGIAAKVLPATVNIRVVSISSGAGETESDDKASVHANRTSSIASGFIIDKTGIIVTNKHVIDGEYRIIVELQDREEPSDSSCGLTVRRFGDPQGERHASVASFEIGRRRCGAAGYPGAAVVRRMLHIRSHQRFRQVNSVGNCPLVISVRTWESESIERWYGRPPHIVEGDRRESGDDRR
jgi:hypothetical protein